MNSHMHMESVASFGGRTGLLYPEQIRKLLARFAITFSDGYFNRLVSLMYPEPNGEVNTAPTLDRTSMLSPSVTSGCLPLSPPSLKPYLALVADRSTTTTS